jgi:ClpP class serine protease
MNESESPASEEEQQQYVRAPSETLTPAASTAPDEKAHHPSLIGRILGAITLSNLFKCFVLWEMLSGSFSWLVGGRSPDKSSEQSLLLFKAQQHFQLEPIGFSPSMSAERKHGYYMKDVAMWEAFEKAGKPLGSDSSTPTVPASPTNVTRSLDSSSDAGGVASEFDDYDSLVQERKEDSSGIPEAASCLQPNRPRTVIVLDLRPRKIQHDIVFIRHAVSFLIGMFRDRRVAHKNTEFEVMVVLESSGGSVGPYGLLADQLRRLRTEPGVTLTVSCDQTALSGGYLLASLASPGQLLAAPFASIGSIGVVTTEMLNFHEALERWGIKPIRFQGGQWKAPMTLFGDISEEDVDHMQEHIDSFHAAFREHVRQWRGDVVKDYDTATSGAYWMGKRAQELGLVDRLTTSDEYIDEKVRNGDRVLKLKPHKEKEKNGFFGRLLGFLPSSPTNPVAEEISYASEFASQTGEPLLIQGLKVLQTCVNAIVEAFGDSS